MRPYNITQLRDCLLSDGFAVVKGDWSAETLLGLGSDIGSVCPHRDSAADGITYISAKENLQNRAGFAGFCRKHLPPHTDRSSLEVPPRFVLMSCTEQAEAGGELYIHDFKEILTLLKKSSPHVVEFLMQRSRVRYVDGDTTYDGPLLEILGNDRFRIRFRIDDNGYYRQKDSAVVQILMQAIEEFASPVSFDETRCVIIDNHRCLHSRSAYCGAREVRRLLVGSTEIPGGFECH